MSHGCRKCGSDDRKWPCKPNWPNRFDIPPADKHLVHVDSPTIVRPVTPTLTVPLQAYPDRVAPGTAAVPVETYRAGIDLVLPAAGDYWIHNPGTVRASVLTLDLKDGEAMGAMPLLREGFTISQGRQFATVGVASAIAVAALDDRRWLTIVNDSANIIYIGEGLAAVVGSGIRLNANGGWKEWGGKNLFRGDVHAIATAAGSNMTISECI